MSEILDTYESELVESLEELLEGFFRDLLDRELKVETANKHVANAGLFLIEYNAFYFLGGVSSIQPERIYDFLGSWYFQRIAKPCKSDINAILVSLKRFFCYLSMRKLIDRELKTQLIRACNDKNFFMNCVEEFILQPRQEFDDEPSDEELDRIARQLADRMALNLGDPFKLDEMINEVDDIPLSALIDQIAEQFHGFQPKDNIISLEPFMHRSRPFKTGSPSRENASQNRTMESLQHHCLELHRSNLVFIRWLDRYGCNPARIPPEAMEICVNVDNMLSFLLIQLEQEKISSSDILQGHRLLDVMDKMLWSARHQIVQGMGLDLRLLPL